MLDETLEDFENEDDLQEQDEILNSVLDEINLEMKTKVIKNLIFYKNL